jgi:predicted PurR-regulated permease PerM
MRKLLPDGKVKTVYRSAYLIRDTFARFLSGQCLEACILAFLILILFVIFGLPHAALIALLAAVLSFIPYIGSFIACFIGTFLTLISDPNKALVCLIVYLAAQLIEQHFIYPHVVGNSVGLSPFYTIVAVIVGGNLFGIIGMIFFIPLFSVIYTIVSEYVNGYCAYFPQVNETETKDG